MKQTLCLPVHVKPSPVNPVLQLQMNDPSVSVQFAFVWHGADTVHSFMSKML